MKGGQQVGVLIDGVAGDAGQAPKSLTGVAVLRPRGGRAPQSATG